VPDVRTVVAAIDMGYGHLRPADALARELGTSVQQMDRAPLGSEVDTRFWENARELYEPLTRISQLSGIGPPMRALLNTITAIPEPWPPRDLSGPTQGTKWLERAARDGVGAQLAAHLRETGATLMTTFFAAAILAELHGATRLNCLVTDSDVNRVWAPADSAHTKIRYFAPSPRVVRRLRSYGVPAERIVFTGYPLPGELVGGRDQIALRRNLAARLVRLRASEPLRKAAELMLGPLPAPGEPPLVVFAVGGAGAQVPLARKLVAGMREAILAGELRLALVAGRRREVAAALRETLAGHALEGQVELLEDPDVFSYFRRFNELLARADVLWSKPSEMTFFAALGLPFVAAPPVGVHESHNLRWASDRGAALQQHDPRQAGNWLREWLDDGVLAGAAWSGFTRLPSLGLYEIARELARD
jgi:hypothetical protein